MTRVAFVSQPWAQALPPSESVAVWTREVARRLAGDHAVVVYARGSERGVRREQDDGVEYRLLPAELDWRAMKAASPLRRLRPARRPFFAGYLFHPAYLAAVTRDLRTLRPDVVHVHNFSQLLPLLRRASPASRLVLHMHCDWLSQLAVPPLRRRLRHAALVLGPSGHVVDGVRRRFPALADRCHVVPNGVDVERFRPGMPVRNRVLFVGRVAPDKGVHVLCDAFRLVLDRRPDAELVLLGPEAPVAAEMQATLSDDPRVRALRRFTGSYVRELQRRLGAAAGQVRFAGRVPFDEVPGWYAQAGLVVNPSLEEAFGMAVPEAMASGLPVVATSVGGMTEIVIDGETGLLVPPDDAAALAQAILHLLDEPERATAMGAAGRKRACSRYAWEHVAAATLALYERAEPP